MRMLLVMIHYYAAYNVEHGRYAEIEHAVGCHPEQEQSDSVSLWAYTVGFVVVAAVGCIRVVTSDAIRDLFTGMTSPEAARAQYDDNRIVYHCPCIKPGQREKGVVSIFDEYAGTVPKPLGLEAEDQQRRKNHECGQEQKDDDNNAWIFVPYGYRAPAKCSRDGKLDEQRANLEKRKAFTLLSMPGSFESKTDRKQRRIAHKDEAYQIR